MSNDLTSLWASKLSVDTGIDSRKLNPCFYPVRSFTLTRQGATLNLELKVGFEPTWAHADGLQDRCHQPLGDFSKYTRQIIATAHWWTQASQVSESH